MTFEERVSEELDALFTGAVFLCAGSRECAEDLVCEAVRVAAHDFAAGEMDRPSSRWFEGILARVAWDPARDDTAHDASEPRRAAAPADAEPATLESVGWADMLRASAAIPRGPRVAIWLVLLRRWPYSEAERAMGVERETLRKLLAHRATFIARLVGSSDRTSTRGGG